LTAIYQVHTGRYNSEDQAAKAPYRVRYGRQRQLHDRRGEHTRLRANLGDGDDTIRTGAGNDKILGGAGRDYIDAGHGYNYINAGSEDDDVKVGDGNDTVYGGSGNDTLVFGAGDDRGYGDSGNDYLVSWGGGIFNGGTGADTLLHLNGPQAFTAALYGGSGNDFLYSDVAGDRINGDAGNDQIVLGSASAYGGAGSDAFIFTQGHGGGAYGISDFIASSRYGEPDKLDFSGLGKTTYEQVDPATVRVTYDALEKSDLWTSGNTLYVHGSDGWDLIFGVGHAIAGAGGVSTAVDAGIIVLGQDFSYEYPVYPADNGGSGGGKG
jgi:Ca2+-binding RTX toxin-like protein